MMNLPSPPPQASALPVPNPTHSFWNTPESNPLAREGSDGILISDADICIIGSGITGVSAAYHLARNYLEREGNSALKVTILESRDFCSGATGRNGGHLTTEIFDSFKFRESTYGTEEAKKVVKLELYTMQKIIKLVKSEGWEDIVDLVSSHRVDLMSMKNEFEIENADYEAALAAKADGIEQVEWLTKEDVFELYGTLYPACRYDGNTIWPLKFVTQLYKLSQKLNPDLSVYTNTTVTAISRSNSKDPTRRWALSTTRGDIQCSYIIHATNGYTSHLLPHMHGPNGIVPTRGQVVALRAAALSKEITNSSWVGAFGRNYWFPRPVSSPDEKPLIINGGGRDERGPLPEEAYTVDDSALNIGVGQRLRSWLPTLFPGKYYEGGEPEMEWTGIMGYTKIGDPFVGRVIDPSRPPDYYEGHYIAAGYTGQGMVRAYGCAEIVAGMIVAELTGEEWVAPEWFPRHFLMEERLNLN